MICAALQKKQRSPPFGAQVIAQALGHDKIKYPLERSIVGRLLFWDHLSDQGSYILCPPASEEEEEFVHKAGLPVLSPPDNPDAGDEPLKRIVKPSDLGKTFDKPMEKDLEEPIELDHLHLILDEGEDGMNPFSFLYLSSEDCLASPASIEANLPPDNLTPGGEPEDKKQATTHINVTSDEVYKSMGEVRQKWLSAGETEIGNLTKPRSDGQTTGALSTITPRGARSTQGGSPIPRLSIH